MSSSPAPATTTATDTTVETPVVEATMPADRPPAAAARDDAAGDDIIGTAAPPAAAITAAPGSRPALDVAFCCDCTGSMGAYIRGAQENIRAIATSIHAKKAGTCDVRFALVAYRDHPPQDTSYVTTVFPFTRQLEVMQSNVDFMSASGGGDGPEAVAAALHEVAELEWGANASKVVVWIADAPPHGLGEVGDGFPNGCPQGNDPLKTLRHMAAVGITVYALGVEPVLSTSYKYARDFMMAAAETTGGKFLPLGRAGSLADVIVGTALEGMELEQLWQETEQAVRQEAAAREEQLSESDLLGVMETRMKDAAARRVVQQVEVQNPYMDGRYDKHNVAAFGAGVPLAECVRQLRPETNAHVAPATAAFAWNAQEAVLDEAFGTSEQASRAYKRGVQKAHGHGPASSPSKPSS